MKKICLVFALVIALFSFRTTHAGVPDPTSGVEYGWEAELHYFQDPGMQYCVGGAYVNSCTGTTTYWGTITNYHTIVWSVYHPICN